MLVRTRLLALGLLALGACGRGKERPKPPPPVVEVVTVASARLVETIPLTGQLEAEASVFVQPEIDGVIASIDFIEGQQVKKGDVLFHLRDDEQVARLREGEARAKLAQNKFERTEKLAAQEMSATAELDRARAENEVARAEAQVSRVAFEKTRIRAPFDGVVGARLVSPGERVARRKQLVRVDAIDRLQLVFALPEIGFSYVHKGMPVRVRVKPFPDLVFEGEVFFVSPTLDPATRRLLLKAWLPNPGRRLAPGLFADLDVDLAARENALVVPESAIAADPTGTFVWRIDAAGIAERTSVTLGTRQEGTVEIASGLSAGDRVVSAGTQKVQAGAPVRIAGETSLTAPTAAKPAEEGESGS